MRAVAKTAGGVFVVDLEQGEIVDEAAEFELASSPAPRVELPRVLATAACGSTIVAVVARRPPLVVSHDAGASWRESGRGLPAGRAVALDQENPDLVLFAGRNRVYLSRDGGRFWSAIAVELPEIEAVAFL